jgi:hypothetical protein
VYLQGDLHLSNLRAEMLLITVNRHLIGVFSALSPKVHRRQVGSHMQNLKHHVCVMIYEPSITAIISRNQENALPATMVILGLWLSHSEAGLTLSPISEGVMLLVSNHQDLQPIGKLKCVVFLGPKPRLKCLLSFDNWTGEKLMTLRLCVQP